MTINERLKILVSALNLSVRAFSQAIEVSENTTRNYLDKGTKPSTDYAERIASHFTNVNLIWLITGKGDMFTDEGQHSATHIKSSQGQVGQVIGTNHGNATQTNNNYTLSDCEKERDGLRAERDSLAKQVELLHGQLSTKDALIASKEETIELLKAAFNRPN